MAQNKNKNLQWGSANRPKVETKLGIPHPTEGSDGDIQVRQTNLGSKLFAKIGGQWNSTFLSTEAKGLENDLSVGKLDISDKIVLSRGDSNIAIGSENSDIGLGNIILGVKAGNRLNADSHDNILIGRKAGHTIKTGDDNICMGDRAGYNISLGSANVFIGDYAGYGKTLTLDPFDNPDNTPIANIAIGAFALQDIDEATYSVAIGYKALENVISGNNNTGVGKFAGDTITSGEKNIFIGSTSDGAAAVSNQIAIGYSTVTTGQYGIAIGDDISAATNDAVMGKNGATITCDFDADGTWTQSSDIRKKANIQDDTLGLSFIDDLKTKTFQWRPANEHPEEWGNFSIDEDGNKTYVDINTNITMHGLIAQEVKESLDKVNCSTFGGWKLREDGQQELSKASFVIPLIKAVQELSAKVDAMQIEINNLK